MESKDITYLVGSQASQWFSVRMSVELEGNNQPARVFPACVVIDGQYCIEKPVFIMARSSTMYACVRVWGNGRLPLKLS
jgi:hypothetical protein